jgi:tetratricopeptide (TPR) repeat protein
MSTVADFESAFRAARSLHEHGDLVGAERAYRVLAQDPEHRERVLRSLAEVYLQASRLEEAVATIVTLTEESPDEPVYYWKLASALGSLGRHESAIAQYRRVLERHPDFAAGYFNLAILYKRALRLRDALSAYERSIELGIDNVQEVYSNIGVLCSEMRDVERAREMYERALSADADYVPALYNLALLCEETGQRRRAKDLYERILGVNPRHWDSLARLGQLEKCVSPEDPIVAQLQQGIALAGDEGLAQESLYFALGKVLDETGSHENACTAYRAANALGERRNPRYDRQATARGFERLAACFGRDWIRQHATGSTASPVFICGMFRSGSTLVEQMLGAHPDVTAGGELDILPWLIASRLSPYPQRVATLSTQELHQLSEEYLSWTRDLFPTARMLTDKRPDNFLHLGLLMAMFPRARIIYTRRNRLDNCLSIYFQQLGGNLGYATNLQHAADYYDRHVELMSHWKSCFGKSIFTVDYDELVRAPRPVLLELLAFLGLKWDDRCLQFQQTDSIVRTASLWQVREGLHTDSSGRWRNYVDLMPELDTLAGQVETGCDD